MQYVIQHIFNKKGSKREFRTPKINLNQKIWNYGLAK